MKAKVINGKSEAEKNMHTSEIEPVKTVNRYGESFKKHLRNYFCSLHDTRESIQANKEHWIDCRYSVRVDPSQ